MQVTHHCPKCESVARVEFSAGCEDVACPHCDHVIRTPSHAVTTDNITQCLVCPGGELYIRKDFPQGLGVTICVAGLASSCIPWYFGNWYGTFAILFGTAIVDALLYVVTGNMLQCYRCQAQYRGIGELDQHNPFNLEIHEKHRQEAARVKQAEDGA